MNNNGIPAGRSLGAGGHRKKDSARIVWDSKPRRAPNPKDIEFQTAEVVIPNPELAGALPLSFRDKLIGEEELDKQKMNRLIWGDNLLAMQALLNQGYEGKVNLIYIDPPFDSKADYSHKIKLGETEFTKEPSVIERLAYKDTWAGGTDSYLDMLYPRLQLMKRLLADSGTIYVHIGGYVNAYVRLLLDEIFGTSNLINEVTWFYRNKLQSQLSQFFPKDTESVFVFAKKYGDHQFNHQYIPLDKPRKQNKIKWDPIHKKTITVKDESGKVVYYESDKKLIGQMWEVPRVNSMAKEDTGYDTQKPHELLERIIKASSSENDLVADFFCGSGTALAVAEKLNRRWIGCELGKVGIQVTRGRLVEQKSKPFLLENIGNYQREMIYLGGARIYEMQKIILKLYGAEPMANRKDLGVRLPAPRRAHYFVYAIRCDDDSIYIGQTEDLSKRWKEHCTGRVDWTASHKPIEVVHHESFATREEAVQREQWLKTGFGRKWIKRELKSGRLQKWDEKSAARQAGKTDDGTLELVYCGYPDRAVAAHKVEDLATEAQTLDGTGYKRLVILAWDYEYNYDELLQARVKAAGKPARRSSGAGGDLKTEIVSRQIPPDIYEYLKQAKSEEDTERLSEKVKFLEKPYLKLQKPEVKGNSVTIGIEKYVLYDFPLGSGKKADEDREELMRLVKDNFAILIDYWAVDWDYDGLTFKSQWQDLRGLGRKTKVVTTKKEHTYEKSCPASAKATAGKKHTIAVRVVDIFGNDATATMEVKI